jgi:hypothetical protein
MLEEKIAYDARSGTRAERSSWVARRRQGIQLRFKAGLQVVIEALMTVRATKQRWWVA